MYESNSRFVTKTLYKSYPRVVHFLERVVSDGSQEDDSLDGSSSIARHQLDANHLAVPDEDVAEHFVEVVHHETDVRIGHLLAVSLRVHLSPAWRRVHLSFNEINQYYLQYDY